MKHIAVNTRLLLAGKLEGIGRFTHEVLQRLVREHPDVHFTFLFDRPYDRQFIYGPNVRAIALGPPARHPLLYVAYFEYTTRAALAILKPDVYFSPDGYLCLGSTVPQVPVFHDLAYVHHPETINAAHRWHYGRYFPRFAHKAAHILTVSEFTKQDIVSTWQIAPSKIGVVYNGVNALFQPSSESVQTETKQRWTSGLPYFLYAGALQPRKNLSRLLQAYDSFRERYPQPFRLVLTGREAWMNEDLHTTHKAMKHADEVVYTGRVGDEELNALYGSATALCYVSLFEGFGLPILEAQHTDTPVLIGNRSSLPEVAGIAALQVDPTDVVAIANGMLELATNSNLREQLISAGRENRERFSWDNTADLVWQGLSQYL
jgi:glycosyltransferase involved in cell wall biosynthesis